MNEKLTRSADRVLYLVNLIFAVWGMWPNKALNDVDEEDDDSVESHEIKDWNAQGIKTPNTIRDTPYTPRTQAFHSLDRNNRMATYQ